MGPDPADVQFTADWANGLFATGNGIEVPLLYATAALGLALIGYGAYSLDAFLGIASRWTPTLTLIVLGAGVIGALANVAVRGRSTTKVGA